MKQLHVYIAAPITLGHRPSNINHAILAASQVAHAGHIPFVPHLYELWDLIDPHPYEFWMNQDFAWIQKCDALIRLPGASSGADREADYAKNAVRIPVYYGIEEFLRHWSDDGQPLSPVTLKDAMHAAATKLERQNDV